MAQRRLTEMVDDIDPTEKAHERVSFMLDGVEYEIDLSDPRADDLREKLAEFVGHARRTGGRINRHRFDGTKGGGAKGGNRGSRSDAGAIRAWAAENGFDLSDRGRIPTHVLNAYEEAKAKPKTTARTSAAKTKRAGAKPAARKAAVPVFTTPGAKPPGRATKK